MFIILFDFGTNKPITYSKSSEEEEKKIIRVTLIPILFARNENPGCWFPSSLNGLDGRWRRRRLQFRLYCVMMLLFLHLRFQSSVEWIVGIVGVVVVAVYIIVIKTPITKLGPFVHLHSLIVLLLLLFT